MMTTENRTPVNGDLDDGMEYQRKSISTWVVEWVYNPDGGGHISIWKKGESSLEHIWTPATIDGEDYHQADEVHFWDWENGQMEYDTLETVGDISDLMWRNR